MFSEGNDVIDEQIAISTSKIPVIISFLFV